MSMNLDADRIKAIVFDMDGTLYISEQMEHGVWESVSRYAGELLSVSSQEGGRQIMDLRKRLTEERGTLQTLAVAIVELGGTVEEMHRRFAAELDPTGKINPDPRVKPLVEQLGACYTSWLLTNNNRTLTDKILTELDLNGSFEKVITIDDTWLPKPHQGLLDKILSELALPPEQVLFVGDRYDIDLRLPEERGCPIFLTKTIDELMQLQVLFPENQI